jgi:hypothetical protein
MGSLNNGAKQAYEFSWILNSELDQTTKLTNQT